MNRPRGLALVAGVVSLTACASGPTHTLVPQPRHVSTAEGAFELARDTRLVLEEGVDAEARAVIERWSTTVRTATGARLEMLDGTGGDAVAAGPPASGDPGAVRIAVASSGAAEGYELSVRDSGIVLVANDHAGLFYGLQTLGQLLPAGVADGARRATLPLRIDAVTIEDAPRFPYRGMHLDVARHFFGPERVKRYIDLLARYKINRFHWHLTEDQGWRIEIDRYPLLTEVGAYRDQTHIGHGDAPFRGDGVRHGGYYTKEEIRDIVAYAEDRYVTIIPEIEMPGHSLAALAAYPGLACSGGPFEVAQSWGVFEDIYCPAEETFDFLEGVLSEVMELFPGEYIHIGGDEAPKTRWEESTFVQDLMRREGIVDEDELQSWFIRRIERFLAANGRRLIGWDEILEGGLAPNATVMSYRGTVGGIEAATQGHDVVMTPYSHLYFDFYQTDDREGEPLAIGGFLPIDTVYAYEPVPDVLSPEQAEHVLGAQANVWTEYMRTWDQVEYMVFPRLFALAEVVWSPAESRDFEDFMDRLGWHLDRLDALGVGYRRPD